MRLMTHAEAAVDRDDGAGDVGAIGSREEVDDSGDFVGIGHPAQGHLAGDCRELIIAERRRHVGGAAVRSIGRPYAPAAAGSGKVKGDVMSNVFPRSMKASYPVAVAGDGCYIIDESGKRYLDGSGGAAVSCLGHSHPAVTGAIKTQLDRLAFAHTGFFTSEPAESLASLLAEYAPEGVEHVYFVSGGSEAVEAALKLARQYFVETGQPDRRHVIARRQSYHGNTLGALAVGGNEWRREQFKPMLIDAAHVAHIEVD